MRIENTCEEILEICGDDQKPYKEHKQELIKLFFQLEQSNISSEEALVRLIELHRKLIGITNRKASYIEDQIARRLLVDMPFRISMQDAEIPEEEIETLQLSYESPVRSALQMSSLLFAYGKEILEREEEKSKRYKMRVKEAIRLLDELNQFYVLPDIKAVFKNKMNDTDKDVQFMSLVGLENYHAHESADEITQEECKDLERIIHTTPSREIASTCCQILINSGAMDELEAVLRMDNWKERNRN